MLLVLIIKTEQYQLAKIDIFFIYYYNNRKKTYFPVFIDVVYLSVSLSKVFKTSFLMYG